MMCAWEYFATGSEVHGWAPKCNANLLALIPVDLP